MPFVERDQLSVSGLDAGSVAPAPVDAVGIGQVFADAFATENSVGALVADDLPQFTAPKDPNFDPFVGVPNEFKGFSDRYTEANTPAEVDAISQQISKEQNAKQRLADAGVVGVVASIAAGVLDPISFIPVGGVAYRTYRTGGSIFKGALVTSSAAATSMAVQESAIHSSQITRSLGESAVNVTAAMFLGGILGAGSALISRQLRADGVLDDVLENIDRDMDVQSPTASTVGAQQAGLSGEDLGIKRNAAVDAVTKAVGFQDPSLRLATSEFDVAKDVGVRLAETPLTLRRNELGIETPISVERNMKVKWETPLYNALRFQDDSYVQYVKGRSKRFGDIVAISAARMAGQHTDKLSRLEFRQAVGTAMRNGDTHDIPEVQAVAQHYRSKVFDPMKNDAIELGLLPEGVDVKTADSYLNRVYNRDALIAKSDRFVQVTTDWLVRKQRVAEQRTAAFDVEIKALKDVEAPQKADIEAREALQTRDLADLDRSVAELEGVANDIHRRILGSPGGRLPYGMQLVSGGPKKAGLSGSLKARVFNIEDELISEFLETDIEAVAKRYVRTLSPDLELTREFGDVELRGLRDDLKNEAARKLKRAKTPAQRKKIESQFKRADADITGIAERLRGVYKLPDDPLAFGPRAGRAVRELNYIAKLGGMTLSAIPDIARPVMVHGFGRVFGDVVVPLVSNLGSLRAMSRQIREDMGGATDMLLNTRARVVAGLEDDDLLRLSKFERGVGAMSDTFGMVSMMAPWNTAMKQIAGTVSAQRIIRAMRAEAGGKISKGEAEYLRSTGISKDAARGILKSLKAHGAKRGRMTLPNITEWGTDAAGREAADTLSAAVTRDIDRIIVTPGQDKPFAASGGWGEFGRHLFQFRSFAIASTQRTMIAGLQQSDTAALNGLWLAAGLGMFATAIKAVDADRDISTRPPEWWIKEGIDRSGLTGWVFDANNMLEKATRGNFGISPMLGQEPLTRYASRNAVGAIFGPTLGSVEDAVQVTGSVASAIVGGEKLIQSDVHAMRRMMPYNNLLGFRQVVDKAEENIGKVLGVRK